MSHAVAWTRRSRSQLFALVVATLVGAPLGAQVNVAAGKPVTLEGMFGVLRPGSVWEPPIAPADPGSAVVDGAFRPEGTQWTDHTLWWDAMVAGSENNGIIIDFGSVFDIAMVTLQADDNDFYPIDFRVAASDPWTNLGYFGTAGSFGMVTRGPFPVSFTASQVRLRGSEGDSYYAISEFQAITATPEPGSMALFATGLVTLAAAARRRRNANVM